MTVNLNGARVLLTGATGGIGHAIARALHARGAELILTGRRTDVMDELAAEVGGAVIAADLADAGAVTRLMKEAGDIDVLVANAALPGVGALVEYTEEQVDRALDINLRAPIILSRWATEQMLPRGRGHIALIGSIAGRASSPLTSMYNATKFGLRGFALAHRDDLHGTGVGVSIIEPGFVSDAGMFVESGMRLPRGARTVSPDDVARAVIRSIDKDLGEVMVAPVELKVLSGLSLVAPRFNSALQRRLGAADILGGHTGAAEKR
ncbi:MAG TPA: SDR family NAD(P)-dependent oxidoreductase [Aeromicrobium sp.]|nr:SDR family NAD(P)-dependent oxidoreductase [Aeromicrobium sp.]